MQTEEEFNLLYSSRLLPVLETLEHSRRSAVNAFMVAILWLAGMVVVLLLGVIFFNKTEKSFMDTV